MPHNQCNPTELSYVSACSVAVPSSASTTTPNAHILTFQAPRPLATATQRRGRGRRHPPNGFELQSIGESCSLQPTRRVAAQPKHRLDESTWNACASTKGCGILFLGIRLSHIRRNTRAQRKEKKMCSSGLTLSVDGLRCVIDFADDDEV